IERKLIIELDGGQHADLVEKDIERTRYLSAKGFRVLRFWNNQVLEETEGVMGRILTALSVPSP
ncbi:MAG: DUF559 domain-containing protein, partial [Candidatus Aureabacteria bacterium]|nr:DUF559 domain-containing protein [Candidatus Auribacterota bacterium]